MTVSQKTMAGLHTHNPGHNSAGDATAEGADICSLLRGRIILIVKCDDIASHPYIPHILEVRQVTIRS